MRGLLSLPSFPPSSSVIRYFHNDAKEDAIYESTVKKDETAPQRTRHKTKGTGHEPKLLYSRCLWTSKLITYLRSNQLQNP